MKLSELVEYMKLRPYTKRQGSKLIAARTHSRVEDVKIARSTLYNEHTNKISIPKILIFDIETSPLKAYVWRLWKNNVNLDHIISEWFCIAWSAKWLYSPYIISGVLTPKEALNEDDTRIMKDLWKLINDADIVVAYNGEAFDIPRINSRFIIKGFPPTKPYFSVDPCKIARKQFGFSSNKLDALAGYFGIPHKIETDFSLWDGCMKGDPESLKYMSIYNKKDVEILEDVYIRMRPWIKGHPNVGNYSLSDKPICSACGSFNVTELKGEYYYTSVGKYQLYKCNKCGAVSRGRKNLNEKNKIKLVSVGK